MGITGYFAVVGIAMLSAFFDWKKRIIPNWLTGGGICFGFLLSFLHGTFGIALVGFCSACFLLIPYRWGWLGGGDLKLLLAYGTLLGAWHLLDLWVGAALLSVPMAGFVAYRAQCSLQKVGIPYAIPLAGVALWIVGKGLLYT